MQKTISPEKQKVREEQGANTDHGSEISAVEVSEETRRLRAQPPADSIGGAYERFLRMPVVVVLATLWLTGIALLGACALMVYLLGTSLVPTLT
jgi:hypothetical protein